MMQRNVNRWMWALLLVLGGLVGPVWGQFDDELDELLGDVMGEADGSGSAQRVASIEIVGLSGTAAAEVRRQIRLKPGDLVSDAAIQRARERITGSGSYVVPQVEREPGFGDGLRLRVHVYRRDPQTRVSVGPQLGVTLAVGDDTLLRGSLPLIRQVSWVDDNASADPDAAQATDIAVDPDAHQITHQMPWGSVAFQYRRVSEHRLDVTVTVHNTSARDLATLRLELTRAIEFPGPLRGSDRARSSGPTVLLGDYGWGAVLASLATWEPPTMLRFSPQRALRLDINRLPAGEQRQHTVSIRLGPGRAAGGQPHAWVRELYQGFAAEHPWVGPEWPDRRPIAAIHPAQSEYGKVSRPETNNLRGWNIGGKRESLDLTTEAGVAEFQSLMMAYGRRCVAICRDINAQGMIVWGVSGLEYPKAQYYGSPEMLPELAPEFDAIADDWFRLFRDAGLRTGLCIRPVEMVRKQGQTTDYGAPMYHLRQQLTQDGGLDVPAVIELLAKKIRYAKRRWGVTLYYVDSNVSWLFTRDPETGKAEFFRAGTMPAQIFIELTRRFPDCLIIPEHETFAYWSGSAPLGATWPGVRQAYPKAFSVNLMQHVNADAPGVVSRYANLVRGGDILMCTGWYDSPTNRVVRAAYQAAEKEGP